MSCVSQFPSFLVDAYHTGTSGYSFSTSDALLEDFPSPPPTSPSSPSSFTFPITPTSSFRPLHRCSKPLDTFPSTSKSDQEAALTSSASYVSLRSRMNRYPSISTTLSTADSSFATSVRHAIYVSTSKTSPPPSPTTPIPTERTPPPTAPCRSPDALCAANSTPPLLFPDRYVLLTLSPVHTNCLTTSRHLAGILQGRVKLQVLNTSFSSADPIPPCYGDANLGGFPDLLLITHSTPLPPHSLLPLNIVSGLPMAPHTGILQIQAPSWGLPFPRVPLIVGGGQSYLATPSALVLVAIKSKESEERHRDSQGCRCPQQAGNQKDALQGSQGENCSIVPRLGIFSLFFL